VSDDAAAARVAFAAITSASNSTEASIVLLRDLGVAFGENFLVHVANRLAGTASKAGPPEIDDDVALARINGGISRSRLARLTFPDDPVAQRNAAERWRRKIAKRENSST
jgi:hypothetical protein